MIVDATSGKATEALKARGATANADVNYDAFLRLLVASMRNQDPTQPNDPSQTLSQLASFSNVEQSIRLNEKLESLLAVSNAGLADGLIGKRIDSLDGKISGIVQSVEMNSLGLTAVLKSGERLPIVSGIRVSQP